jgi:hypothetical protein
MKVFTLVQIIERDCDVKVESFATLQEAMKFQDKLTREFIQDWGSVKIDFAFEENSSIFFMESKNGSTDQQIVIKETEI